MLAVRPAVPPLMEEIARQNHHMFMIDATSALVRWLYAQPQDVQHAVLRAGSGSVVHDEEAIRSRVTFGTTPKETHGRASSSGTPQSGKRARPAA